LSNLLLQHSARMSAKMLVNNGCQPAPLPEAALLRCAAQVKREPLCRREKRPL
jgi:hypothetical protein